MFLYVQSMAGIDLAEITGKKSELSLYFDLKTYIVR